MVSTNSRARVLNVLSASFLAATLGFVGCGGGNKQVASPVTPAGEKSQLAGGSGENACKSKDDCPPTASDISATFAPSGALIGFVGEPVNWDFHGVDTKSISADAQSSGRKVVVLLDRVPSDAQIVPGKGDKLDAHARIDWTPAKVYAKKELDIILRDYERCVMDLSEDDCNTYSFKKDYDVKQTVPWEIADRDQLQAQLATGAGGTGATGNVVNVANPNCGPATTTNGAINTTLFTTGLGVLLNPKAALPGLLSGMMSGGLGGGATQAPPTQC